MRRDTSNSCEIALVQCQSQSSSDKGARIMKAIIISVREELLEATDPEIYARRMEEREMEENGIQEEEDDEDSLEMDASLVDEQEKEEQMVKSPAV